MVVIITYVGDGHPAVVKVVLYVASGGGVRKPTPRCSPTGVSWRVAGGIRVLGSTGSPGRIGGLGMETVLARMKASRRLSSPLYRRFGELGWRMLAE